MIKFKKSIQPVEVGFDLKDFDNTVLRKYSKSEREKSGVVIKPLIPSKTEEIRAKHTKYIFVDEVAKIMSSATENIKESQVRVLEEGLKKMGFGTREIFGPEQRSAYNDDILDEVIVSWFGFFDDDGNEIKCTRENKVSLFRDGFYQDIGLRIIDIAVNIAHRDDILNRKEVVETEKKSEPSQDGLEGE